MKTIILLLVIILNTASAEFEVFSDYINRVIDGDTIIGNKHKYRLAGVNTPERGQINYFKAKSYMQSLVLRKHVVIVKFNKKSYDRHIAIVHIGKICINKIIRKKYNDKRYDRLLTKEQKKLLIRCGWK